MTPESVSQPREREKKEVTTQRLPLIRLSDRDLPEEVELPDRYRIREEEGRVLTCLEAPTLRVRVERGLSVSASAARSAEPGTIFLDGAAKSPPFLDIEGGVLNLDHHEGCIRSFTLSTCEQAFVIVSKGIDLQSREWTVWANEPDLDTLLAIWVLLNHRRVRTAPRRLLRKLVPMIRLEGAIDVHGFDLRDFCGFPSDLESSSFAHLEHVRREEAELKQSGLWTQSDPLEYTANQLRVLDRLLYSLEDFEGLDEIEELSRAELPEQKLAIACRSEVGIYRVEEQLKEVYGERLGIVVLQKDENAYTLRQSSAFSRSNLERIYERLNLIDPSAGNSQSAERWGGSSEIGGSPRGRGTRLSLAQIVEAVRQACTKVTPWRLLGTLLVALLATGGVYAISALPFLTLSASQPDPGSSTRALAYATGLLLLGSLTLVGAFWQGPGVVGLRRPVGWRWLFALPVALITGLMGGGWLAADAATPGLATAPSWWAILGLAVGAEILFRGVAQGSIVGLLAGHHKLRSQTPALLSALLYATWTAAGLLPLHTVAGLGVTSQWLSIAITFLAAYLFGLSLGWARQVSESLAPPLLIHVSTAVALALFLG